MKMRELIDLLEAMGSDEATGGPDTLFTAAQKTGLPQSVIKAAKKLYKPLKNNPYMPGAVKYVDGYSIEVHTLTSRDDDQWAFFRNDFEKYKKDKISIVSGDPEDGVFVTVTPRAKI